MRWYDMPAARATSRIDPPALRLAATSAIRASRAALAAAASSASFAARSGDRLGFRSAAFVGAAFFAGAFAGDLRVLLVLATLGSSLSGVSNN
jgi:hypothetical protein